MINETFESTLQNQLPLVSIPNHLQPVATWTSHSYIVANIPDKTMMSYTQLGYQNWEAVKVMQMDGAGCLDVKGENGLPWVMLQCKILSKYHLLLLP